MAGLGTAFSQCDAAVQMVNGAVQEMIPLLEQTNSMAKHIPWYPTNKDTSHVTVVQTGIPQPSLRRLNQGVAPTKTTGAQVEDGLCQMEARGQIDVDTPCNGSIGKLRITQNRGHIEGFMQYFQYLMLYGTEQLDPKQFNGLSIRYNALTGNVSDQVVNAGGTGTDNTSVWLIGWGENTVHGIYPRGTAAGLKHEDKNQEFVPTSVTAGALGSGYYAWTDRFVWKCGLAVPDYRYVVRIPNIDISDLTGAAAGSNTQASTAVTYLIDLLADALERIPNPENPGVNLQFYCSRKVRTWLRRQSAIKSSSQINFETPAGHKGPILTVHGVPLNICDQITAEDDVPVLLSDFP